MIYSTAPTDVSELNKELAQRKVSQGITVKCTSATYVNVISISDKGVFTGVSQCLGDGATAYGELKVVIDGVTIIDTIDAAAHFTIASTNTCGNNSLSFNHRFNTSLQIQHARVTGSPFMSTTASWTIDE